MFLLFLRRLWPRPPARLDDLARLTPEHDDAARRLLRASETPRRLDLHADSGFRALHGRDPPPYVPPRPK